MAIRAAACLAITYTLGGLVQGPWQLFWVRVLQGLSAGLWPATLAIMSAHAPHNRLGFSMGVMQAGLTAGGVLGPLIGGLLAEYIGMRSTFLASGAALFLITLVLAFCVTDSPAGKKSAAAKETADAAATRPNPLRLAVVQRMLFAAGVVQLTILMTQPVLPLYIAELQGSMESIVLISGIVFSIVGILGVFA